MRIIAFGWAIQTGLIDYQLTIIDDAYTLIANTQSILTGPLRDYSDFDGFPDPYQTPNFLFLGDDTTSAQARVRLGYLAITGEEPVLPTAANTSTSSPSLTAPFTPLPSNTPVPSPIPTRKVPEVCPSGGFFLVVMSTSTMLIKFKRKSQG